MNNEKQQKQTFKGSTARIENTTESSHPKPSNPEPRHPEPSHPEPSPEFQPPVTSSNPDPDSRANTVDPTGPFAGFGDEFERQLKALTSRINAEGWTVISDYSATGEGRHVYYLRSNAGSEVEARDAFRARFFANADEERWAWELIGVEVHRGAFWPDFLKGYRTPPDVLEMHWPSRF
jgi:hypothetical protein